MRMRGILLEETGCLREVEQEVPKLSDGMALVRIQRIGICGTDQHAYRGNQPFFTYPRVLGHELAGVIEAIDSNEAGLVAGDQVGIIPYVSCGRCIACRKGKTNCCTDIQVMGVHRDGGMCELLAVPIANLIATPDLTLDQTAVLEPLSIGAHAVRRAAVEPGETVLVIGAGPIGLGVMAFAKHQGARVIAMDINDQRLDFCRDWAKADETVNPSSMDTKTELERLTDGDYPTIVFDATGNKQSMMQSLHYVAHGGKLVYVGLVKADLTFHHPDMHKRELTLMGSRNATSEDFQDVMEAINEGSIDVSRYITHRAPFGQLVGKFEEWLQPEAKVIKAIVEL